MKNKPTFSKINKIWTATILSVAVFLLFTIVATPLGVASAETPDENSTTDWEQAYVDYLESKGFDEWYFGEEYLDLYGALEVVNGYLSDSTFDKETLKADPIIVAVIDNGICAAYGLVQQEGGSYAKQRVGISHIFKDKKETEFYLHPIFEDVILKDANGNYVYKVMSSTFEYVGEDGESVIYNNFNTGNIAQDMVAFDNHGTGVSGMIALMIHQLGLQDYIKILPIKADTKYAYDSEGIFRQYYNNKILDEAVEYAYSQGADVVNASFNGTKNSSYEKLELDVLIASAAGNDGQYADKNDRPIAGSPNVIGVMDYTRDTNGELEFTYYSNWGEDFDVLAPGKDAIGPCYQVKFDNSYYGYGSIRGTSMATTFGTFAGALAMFRYRGYDGYGAGIELTPKIVKEMVSSSSSVFVEKGGVDYGTINYKNILTHNFYSDDVILQKSTVLINTENDLSCVIIGDCISLEATFADTNIQHNNRYYWWYVLGGETYEIGYGEQIDFTVPQFDGEYEIFCEIQNENGGLRVQGIYPIRFTAKYALENVSIFGAVESEYKVDTTENVTLTAVLNPTNAHVEDTLVWLLKAGNTTTEIGEGLTLNYDIPNAVGEYEIKCAFKNADGYHTYSTNAIAFAVEHYEVEDVEISVQVESVEGGKVANCSLPKDLLNPEDVASAKWYVNGTLVAQGSEFTLSVSTAGNYVVVVEVDGRQIEVCNFTIEAPAPTPPVGGGNTNDTPNGNDQQETPSQGDENGMDVDTGDSNEGALIAVIAVLSVVSVASITTAVCLVVKKKRNKSAGEKE